MVVLLGKRGFQRSKAYVRYRNRGGVGIIKEEEEEGRVGGWGRGGSIVEYPNSIRVVFQLVCIYSLITQVGGSHGVCIPGRQVGWNLACDQST